MKGSILRHPGWWMANIWLVFLLLPLAALLSDGDRSMGQRLTGAMLFGLFAILQGFGYRAILRREIDTSGATTATGRLQLLDPRQGSFWFVMLIVVTVVGFGVVGWHMLGVFPFLVSYGVFNFSKVTAAVVVALALAVSIIGPAIDGVLEERWFIVVAVIGVAAVAALIRVTEQHQAAYAQLQAELLITEERERVARDVHDVLGHSLTAIILKAQVVDRLLTDSESPAAVNARLQLAEMDAVSRTALAEIRSTVTGLRTADLSTELSAARAVLADAGIDVTVHGDVSDVPHPEALGWVVREACTNVVRHSHATRCEIRLAPKGDVLQITDDGNGLNGNGEGNGLRGLRERLAEVDLTLHLDGGGETQSGTRVRIQESTEA